MTKQKLPEAELPRQILELNASIRQEPRDSSRRYLAVAGNIGAGKSSLVEFLCDRYELTPYFEPNEANPYLEDFYGDMRRWAFSSQMYFLGAKFRLHTELEAHPAHVLQDRTIWEDAEIFAYNLYHQKIMNERDWKTYWMFYETIRDQLRPPDLMIYLRCPVRTVRKRIAMRGRQMEQNIPTAYLQRLHKLYEDWIARYTLSPVVVIPTDQLDYMTNIVDRHDIMTTIEKYIR